MDKKPGTIADSADEEHSVPQKKKSSLSRLFSIEDKSSGKKSCPDYFGVRSYLHNFYQSGSFKDPHVYEEDDDFRYLLHPNMRRRRCRPLWWKLFLWLGANLLVFGLIGIFVGYLVPQKQIVFDIDKAKNIAIIDKEALSYNGTLDMCKLIGLVVFCLGGVTLAMALLFPSFLSHYCDEDGKDDSIRVTIGNEEKLPLSPIEMTIPATPKIKNIQPDRSGTESVVTKDGMVRFKDN